MKVAIKNYDLNKALQQGCEKALTQIFDAYKNKLYAFCLKTLKSPDLAEEVMTESFIRLWESRDNINPALPLEAYLYKITKNQLINFLRKTARDEKLLREVILGASTSHSDTENEVIFNDYERITQKVIDCLPSQRQMIYRLSREEGLTYEEIARRLNVSRNTVKTQMKIALHQMRAHLTMLTDITFILLIFHFA